MTNGCLSSEQVTIQPSEWHRALLLPQAWRGFMSRAFQAVLQVCAALGQLHSLNVKNESKPVCNSVSAVIQYKEK